MKENSLEVTPNRNKEGLIVSTILALVLAYAIFSDRGGEQVPKEITEHYAELQGKYVDYVKAGRVSGYIAPEQIDTLRDLYIIINAEKAREIHEKHKIPASIVMAQAILESESGTSELSRVYHNIFNIKHAEHSKPEFYNKKFQCCVQKNDDNTYDHFKVYKSDEECLKDYVKLLKKGGIKKSRYRKCFACGDDVECWARELEKAGFATDKQYAESLINLMKKYELNELDTQ